MSTKSLIPRFEHICRDDFTDFFTIVAKNIEDSMIQSGATPGKDYTILDLYKLAQPFVLHCWQQPDKTPLEFTLTWPNSYDERNA
jgi:hypothetical protein